MRAIHVLTSTLYGCTIYSPAWVFVAEELTLDEINEEIRAARKDLRKKEGVGMIYAVIFLVTGNLKHYPSTPKVITPADFIDKVLNRI